MVSTGIHVFMKTIEILSMVCLTIEDFIELSWWGVHHKICHDADLGIRKTSLYCFCIQFLLDKINFLFLAAPAVKNELPESLFISAASSTGLSSMSVRGIMTCQQGEVKRRLVTISCRVGSSVRADRQMAHGACNP